MQNRIENTRKVMSHFISSLTQAAISKLINIKTDYLNVLL